MAEDLRGRGVAGFVDDSMSNPTGAGAGFKNFFDGVFLSAMMRKKRSKSYVAAMIQGTAIFDIRRIYWNYLDENEVW